MSDPARMTTGVAPAYGGNVPYGQAPGQPMPPQQTQLPPAAPPKRRRGRGFLVAAMAVTALISAGIGGGIVAAVNHTTSSTPAAPAAPPAPTAEQVHAENVRLCTAYATYNSALPTPPKSALEIYPVVNGIRWALAESLMPVLRSVHAITELVHQYDGDWRNSVTSEPAAMHNPRTGVATQCRAADNHVWDVCQLGN